MKPSIAVVGNAGETVRLTWVRSKIPVQHLGRNYSAPLKGSSLAKVFDSGEPRVINDLVAYLAAHPESESTRLIVSDGIRSNLTCRLKANNKPVGIVFFSCSHLNAYDHAHVTAQSSKAQTPVAIN